MRLGSFQATVSSTLTELSTTATAISFRIGVLRSTATTRFSQMWPSCSCQPFIWSNTASCTTRVETGKRACTRQYRMFWVRQRRRLRSGYWRLSFDFSELFPATSSVHFSTASYRWPSLAFFSCRPCLYRTASARGALQSSSASLGESQKNRIRAPVHLRRERTLRGLWNKLFVDLSSCEEASVTEIDPGDGISTVGFYVMMGAIQFAQWTCWVCWILQSVLSIRKLCIYHERENIIVSMARERQNLNASQVSVDFCGQLILRGPRAAPEQRKVF